MVTSWLTVIQVHLSRGQASARELMGEFVGCLITDRWTGHGWWPLHQRHLCWAQMIREFQKIADRGGHSKVIGEGLLAQAHKLFELWRRVSLGTQSALGSQFVARMLTVMKTLRAQQRPVLEFLTVACEAARQGTAAPSLLPDLSVLDQEHHLATAACSYSGLNLP